MKIFCKTFFTAIILCVLLSACQERASFRKTSGQVWNTFYNITYNSPVDLTDTILATMRRVELSLSPFCDSSLVSRLNRGERVEPDSMLLHVFRASLQVNASSFGAFDPTVSPLINLWGFGYKNDTGSPSPEAIDSMLLRVGIARCDIDSAGHIVGPHPETEYNFSAITKGFGCDEVGRALERNGVTDYMVEIGGEISLRGLNSRREEWRIMIEAPIENDSAFVREGLRVVTLTDCGIATSGNYRNHNTDAQGQRRWHTISPLTGYPAETTLLSATVIAPSAMLADAFATSAMALSPDSAMMMFAALPDVEALLVTPDTILLTPGFPQQ